MCCDLIDIDRPGIKCVFDHQDSPVLSRVLSGKAQGIGRLAGKHRSEHHFERHCGLHVDTMKTPMDIDAGLATGTVCFVVFIALVCCVYNIYRRNRTSSLYDLQEENPV